VIKQSAATPGLMTHTGRALVWDSLQEYLADADDPALDVNADDILIVRNVGPKGYPGMPEVGNMPLPRKLLEQGVRDMVRISDARMSGTAYGTVILHVAPEAAAGGPLAFVRTGDIITVDVVNRILSMDVSDDELQSRTQAPASEAAYAAPLRGWEKLYVDHVMQADTGADLDFLVGSSGSGVSRESH
jgi:dihydroxy-acid dehydratase